MNGEWSSIEEGGIWMKGEWGSIEEGGIGWEENGTCLRKGGEDGVQESQCNLGEQFRCKMEFRVSIKDFSSL